MLNFEWGESKNKSNRFKHGIWFEEAQTVFLDQHMRYFHDLGHSESEDRFIALGYSSSNRLLVVAHSYREVNETVRIISARKVTQKERKFYEERI